MSQDTLQQNLRIAETLASKYQLNTLDLILLSINTLDAFDELSDERFDLKSMKKIIRLGLKEFSSSKKKMTFKKALEHNLKSKMDRSPRTLQEIRYFSKKLLDKMPEFKFRTLDSVTPDEWEALIPEVFTTPRQQSKARVVIHGIYSGAEKNNWCDYNPITAIPQPAIEETRARALTADEANELIENARTRENGSCLLPLSLMLYAGVRPSEVQRLTFSHIDLANKKIYVPSSKKNKKDRVITIEPVLHELLSKELVRLENDPAFLRVKEKTLQKLIFKLKYKSPDDDTIEDLIKADWKLYISVCPKNWIRKWTEIRNSAGWSPKGEKEEAWSQDALRHTYAYFYLIQYKDIKRLQKELGHRSADILNDRYAGVQHLDVAEAKPFWQPSSIKS